MSNKARAIRPDDLGLFAQIPGIVGVARNEQLDVIWCTPSYGQIAGNNASVDEMVGSTVEDILPTIAANERIKAHRQVMDTNEPQHHFRLINDSRVLCTILPLDEQAFGHRGVFVIVHDAPNDSMLNPEHVIPVLSTPNLCQLNTLTRRELEVLHLVASGMSTHQISERICRANKTIEHHINAIHGKLGTTSRAQLVRFASERGIQSFSDEEWASIVTGAQTVRNKTI